MNMKQEIVSPLSRTYKPVNSSLVYTKAEGCSLSAREFSRKSMRNKPVKSDFPVFKLFDSLENSKVQSMLLDIQRLQ